MQLTCPAMSAEATKVQNFGIAACASQSSSDQMGAVIELGKGLHFGPTATLADAATSLTQGDHRNYCARAVKAATEYCPHAFDAMEKSHRDALAGAAN